MISPYDFNQSIAHRAEYVEERLKGGAPVVAISYDNGILVFTIKRTQRKVFEIYDKLVYSAIGNQADVEAVRLAAIDFAHQEGFARSPDDVSIQRLVGFTLSPPLKRAFGDAYNTPNVLRALFAEIGNAPADDSFFVLNYDGEFTTHSGFAVVAGSESSEDAMRKYLQEKLGDSASDPTVPDPTVPDPTVPDLKTALQLAQDAWREGSRDVRADDDDENDNETSSTRSEAADALQEALKHGHIEAGILERNTPRESKFRLLKPEEINHG